MPVLGREALADQLVRALAGDRLEHELVGLLVEQEDRRRLGAEDRARDLDDRLQQLAVALLGAERRPRRRRRRRSSLIVLPPTLFAVR